MESAAETPAIFLKALLELSANRRNKSRAAAGGVRFYLGVLHVASVVDSCVILANSPFPSIGWGEKRK